MSSVSGESRQVKGKDGMLNALRQAHSELLKAVSREISEQLVVAVSLCLHRLFHQRREGVGRWEEGQGYCQRCKSRAVCDFTRNGYRERTLLTPMGWIEFFLPRVRCGYAAAVEGVWQWTLPGWCAPTSVSVTWWMSKLGVGIAWG